MKDFDNIVDSWDLRGVQQPTDKDLHGKNYKNEGSAVATAEQSMVTPCQRDGHNFTQLGEAWMEHEPTHPGSYLHFLALVRYALLCTKCGQIIEYTQDRRNRAK